jgi:S-adenosylmethionine/arginine decarboxylase-like enzyme
MSQSIALAERPVSSTLFTSNEALREEYARLQAWGLLASIDLHDCDNELIQNPEAIKRYVVELTDLIGMVRHGETHIDQFGEGELLGYSFFQFIETSSVTGHFDDKVSNAAYIDIFSCKYFDPGTAAEFSQKFFKAEDYKLTYLLRK